MTTRADLVPLGPRLGALFCLRFAMAVAVLASTVASPGIVGTTPARVAPVMAVYLILINAVELLRRWRGRLPLAVTGATLLVDGLVMAVVVAVSGGPGAALTALLLVHLVAVTLAASYRTGLKLALWDSLLLIVAYYAPSSLVGRSMPLDEAVFAVTAFWGVAVATSVFSALNERDLRRSRSAAAALAGMARQMEATPDADDVVIALLSSVATQIGDRRAAVLLLNEAPRSAWTLVDGYPVGVPVGDAVAGSTLQQVLAGRELCGKRELRDPLVDLVLPQARNLVIAPLVAEGAPLGALLVEWGGPARTTIPASLAGVLNQLSAHAALAYRNARLVEEVRRLATSDGLTGVANRRTFDETLAREVARAARTGEALSLVLIDVDHFKKVNDVHGHQVGDEVLRHVGRVLVDGARLADLPARYGGEEFAVILPGASSGDALMIAERLRAAIASGGPVSVTASAGVATVVAGRVTPDELVATADRALYAAKRAGRDRAVAASAAHLSAA